MGNRLDTILAKSSHSQEQTYNQQQRYYHQYPPHHQHQRPSDYHHGQHEAHYSCEKQYNHKQYSCVPEKKKQKSSLMGSHRRKKGKLSSCPDLLKETSSYYYAGDMPGLTYGLKEYRHNSPERSVDIKIYRSYTDLPQQSDMDQPLKIKVYRKSQESLTNVGRVQSMPRGMNKTGSSEFSNSIESRLSVATQEYNRPPSRRSSSRCSNASGSVVNCRASINLDEFPNSETVTNKLAVFEQFFTNLVVKYFKNLTILDQLACICVAVMPDRANQSVSLLQYFQSTDIPPDLGRSQLVQESIQVNSGPGKSLSFYPALPDILLDEVYNAKLNTPLEDQASVCQDVAIKIISHLAREAATELGRMYEYQLSLIQETIAFRLLAKFAATNVFEAVKSRGKLLDQNSIVSAAMNQPGRRSAGSDHGGSSASPKWISVICFSKELKWNIYDIFRKAALRKDVFAQGSPKHNIRSPSISPSSIKRMGHNLSPPLLSSAAEKKTYDPENSPWKFYTNSDSDPMTYGYRGQPIQWDFVRRCYRLSANDEMNFVEELPWRYDDAHRLYCPCIRLVCDLHLLEYCNWLRSFRDAGTCRSHGDSTASVRSEARPTIRGLEEYVRQVRSGVHVREEIKLVYRSVAGFNPGLSKDSKRSDLFSLKESLVKKIQSDSTFSSRCATEVFSTPEMIHRSTPSGVMTAEVEGHRDAESLRMALAQVTMECDQLCFNLKDMESSEHRA